MSWEDVPCNPIHAHRQGYGLSDCPFPAGSHEESMWRVWWVQMEADHQDIRTNSLEAAVQVHPSTLPPARTEVDDLIDSFSEPDPPPSAPELQGLDGIVGTLTRVMAQLPTGIWADLSQQVRSVRINFEPPPLDLIQQTWARVSQSIKWQWPKVRVPRSATQIVARVSVPLPHGGIAPRDAMRQIMIEEQAKLALRDRSKLRITDLTS